MQMYSDAPQCVRARLQVCSRMRPSTYLWILSRCKLTESFQYCLLAVFKCLLNTVFGRSAECNNGMWKMCDFIILLLTQSTNALLATCPWKFKFGKLAIVRICTMFALCVGVCALLVHVNAAPLLSLNVLFPPFFSSGLYASRSKSDCWSLELP